MTEVTSFLSPSSSAATAACDPVQNKQLRMREVNAAMSSRCPGESGDGPRITSCVNIARKRVRSGLKLKRCRICGTSIPAACIPSAAAPQGGAVLAKPKAEKNILDWLIEFRSTSNPAAFNEQEAHLVGFVYRDDRFAADTFMVSRFVLSCCAADAAPLGLMVRWPESSTLTADQWVEVTGHFEPGEFDGEPMPILIAEKITPTTVPDQPYLYPY